MSKLNFLNKYYFNNQGKFFDGAAKIIDTGIQTGSELYIHIERVYKGLEDRPLDDAWYFFFEHDTLEEIKKEIHQFKHDIEGTLYWKVI